MALLDMMIKTYGYNEPILISEIKYGDYSRPWLYKELNRLCEEGSVVRFDKGLYYVPKQTALGMSMMNPGRAIEKKYIKSKDEVFGYYSGQFFMNRIGLSNQMPNIIEIFTNNESAKVRDVNVGSQKVRLRKSRVEVTKDNFAVLSFLELMNIIDADALDDGMRESVVGYIKENKITRKDIKRYSKVFPDKVMRALIESEVVYAVTQ